MNLKNNTSLYMMFTLYIMTIFSMCLNNFLLLWILMEISSLIFVSMICLMNFKKNSILYYIMSSISSLMMMFTYMFIMYDFMINYNLNIQYILFILSIWIKMGLYPMHFWTNILFKNLNYMLIFMFSTLIKLIPTLIIFNYINLTSSFSYLLLLTLIISPFLMLMQSNLKLMFSYSTMFNSALMIMLIYSNNIMWMMYFILYTILSFMLFNFLNEMNITNLMNFKLNLIHNNFNKNFLNMLILMYCQFPPMSTFLMKLNMSKNMMYLDTPFISFIMLIILLSLFMTYNYLNFFNTNFLKSNIKPIYMISSKSKNKSMNKFIMFSMIMISILFIPIEY